MFSVFIYRFFTGLSLRLRADISKVIAHERIQYLQAGFETHLIYFCILGELYIYFFQNFHLEIPKNRKNPKKFELNCEHLGHILRCIFLASKLPY
jgi:hypothetical protein